MRLRRRKNYRTLEDALFDQRQPPRTVDEFRMGITFVVKLVGCGTVPRPNSRMEIVSAMRRIRSDCRLRKDKKRKTILTVSDEGVRIALSSNGKNFLQQQQKRQSTIMMLTNNNNRRNSTITTNNALPSTTNNNLIITHHPIHRIFYVSHDSSDLHIFSYIAREGSIFRCFVFKAAKQSLAINIVRTIGQAFELCHKIPSPSYDNNQSMNGQIIMDTNTINDDNRSLNHHHHQNHHHHRPNRINYEDINGNIDNDNNDDNGNELNDDGDIDQSSIIRMKRMARSKSPPPSNLRKNSKDLTFNMEQMIKDVDSKLDNLSNKIELMEKQISTLLSSMTINNNGGGLSSTITTHPNSSTASSSSINPRSMIINDRNNDDHNHHHHHHNHHRSYYRRSPTVRFSESAERMFIHNNPRASSIISTDTASDTNTIIASVDDYNDDDDKNLTNKKRPKSKTLYSPDSSSLSNQQQQKQQLNGHYNYYQPNIPGSCLLFKDLY